MIHTSNCQCLQPCQTHMLAVQDFYAFYQGLPLPKRLMAFSKFGTTHYASDGERHQPSSGIKNLVYISSIRISVRRRPIIINFQVNSMLGTGSCLAPRPLDCQTRSAMKQKAQSRPVLLKSHLPASGTLYMQVHHIVPTTGGSILKIPMKQTYVRSLNLSVSVGIGVYEAIRQLDGPFL